MKKITILLAILIGAFQSIGQSIPNGGFEAWSNHIWQDPTNYFSSNSRYVPYGYAVYVQKTNSAYHGSAAVQLQTTKVGPDTISAYFANGNPGGPVVPGGIPYNRKPTGIRFYYKCSIMTGDTGLVIAIFKLAGSVIGNYVFKVYGNVASYTLSANMFAPALTQTPDTVVFGATSSNLLINNFRGIPGSNLTIDSVTFTGVVSQPALLDGDFENWTMDTATFPNSWVGTYPGVFMSTDKYSGTYALELTTQAASAASNNSAQPGIATTGNWFHYGWGGTPFNNQVDTLVFYYKYSPYGADTANVNVSFKKNGSIVNGVGRDILGQPNYAMMSIPFNVGQVPDSVIVTFSSTRSWQLAAMHVGSDLKIDNLSMKSQPFGVADIVENTSFKAYPNPCSNILSVDMQQFKGSVEQIGVYDITGKLMESKTYGVGYRDNVLTLDLGGFAGGTYILNIKTSAGTYYQRVSKI